MGQQHGELLRQEVHELAKIRLELARMFAREHGVRVTDDDCRLLAKQLLPIHEEVFPEVFDEWRGIAKGADLSMEDIFFANALTDFQDVLWQFSDVDVHGCTAFMVSGEATQSQSPYLGQTWDMHASAEPFIHIFSRVPKNGPSSLVMTTAGCLTLVGVNSEGLAVGNTNLRPRDARLGVIYLAILHETLRQKTISAATSVVTDSPRASGHNYLLSSAVGDAVNIETTARQKTATHLQSGWFVHTNHYLSKSLLPLEDSTAARDSTEYRLQRIRQNFENAEQPFTPESLRHLLADHEGGDSCICRHGTRHQGRSCAFVVVDPQAQSLWCSLGPPCEGVLTEYRLAR